MRTRTDLEKKVADLEGQVEALKRGGVVVPRGVRRRSAATFAGLPIFDLAVGPDVERGEVRGHAKGIIAIGDIATGVLAIGGGAVGYCACGGGVVGEHVIGPLERDPVAVEFFERYGLDVVCPL